MRTMRAAVLSAIGEPLQIVTRPIPEPGIGEVRVKIEACGVCGSDLFLQRGGFGADSLPIIPGHEAAGVVDTLGPDVNGLTPGDQVALYYIDADPAGAWAQQGRENLDPALRRMGVDDDGAFAEYVVRPAHTLIRTPRHVEPAALAVLTDAVATPFHALRLARVQGGDRVLVLGIGGIGSNAVQLARRLGAHVTAAGRNQDKLGLALELGAERTIQLCDEPELDRVRLCGGAADASFDVVIQCAGSGRADELAIAAAGPGGRIVLVGMSKEPFTARSVDLIWRELELLGSRGFTARDVADVIDLYLEGSINVEHLVRHIRPLAEANDALEDLRTGTAVRTVIDPTR